MVKINRLIWDEWNLNHIAKHGVSKKEVEIAVGDKRAVIWKHRGRYVMVASSHGRVLFIVLEKVRGEKNAYYVITARDATNSEKRIYRTRGK
ncbi:BrnT family toxin [Archaeoglobus neptunius]|uniref:BrnT family toxin n=1 Tax=Archaeoglobus neptunius TaxID=2798580 RepID=UPI001929700B|nr:BrnT family toxin [Archaeoglobus neptunius]